MLINNVIQGGSIGIPNNFDLLRDRSVTNWSVEGIISRKGDINGNFSVFTIFSL
jgi:hypothetical protein